MSTFNETTNGQSTKAYSHNGEPHRALHDSEAWGLAIDDLVPGDAESPIYGEDFSSPHETERQVLRALLSMPNAKFSSLGVHRLDQGVCLTGVVRVSDDESETQLEQVAGTAAGVAEVLNRLVVQKG